MTTDNQSGGDAISTTWLNGAITAYGTAAAADTTLQGSADKGRKAQQLTDEVNRISGSATKTAVPNDLTVNKFGGSTNAQVAVGARQW